MEYVIGLCVAAAVAGLFAGVGFDRDRSSNPIVVIVTASYYVLFAVLGGMQAFGFVGLVIGPLVFSLLMTIIDIYKRSFHIRRSESELA